MISQLLFNALLKTSQDKPFSGTVSIQYLEPKGKTWQTLLEKCGVANGALAQEFPGPEPSAAAKTILSFFSQADAGSQPLTRLVSQQPLSALSEVIGYANTVAVNPKAGVLEIGFPEAWVMDSAQIKDMLAAARPGALELGIAVQCPPAGSVLYKALLAAVSGTNRGSTGQEEAGLSTAKALAPNTIYSGMVKEISKASAEMAGSNYRISGMSLDLKVLATHENEEMKLMLVDPAMASRLNGDALSNLHIEISAGAGTKANTAVNPMPNVTGCTETEARRRLQQYGLRLKAVYQLTDKYILGQSFKQSPGPGTEIIEGSEVIVVFAKNKTEFH